MQDNPFDKQFMDNAWSQMNNQLNEVMPQERKRRFVFWWWFLPSLGAAAIILLFLLPNSPEVNQLQELISTPNDQTNTNMPIAQLETDSPKEQQAKNPNSVQKENTTQPIPTNKLPIQQINKPTNEQTAKQNNNPIYPEEQDPVTQPAFQDPEAIVLHTATETLESDQRIAPAAPVTDLRFLNLFDPLNLDFHLVQSITNFNSVDFGISPPKVSKLYDRRGTAAAFVGAGLNTASNQADFAVGIGWKQKRGRLFLRLEPGFHLGETILSPPSNVALDNVSMETDTSFDPTSIPQEALGGNAIQNNAIPAQFATLSIPLTLGYQFSPKWSMEGGLQWSKALRFRAKQALNEDEAVRLQNGANSSFSQGEEIADLRNFLERNNWVEGRVGLNFRWSKRLELQAAYRFGQVNFTNTDQLVWDRDQYALRLRYRLR